MARVTRFWHPVADMHAVREGGRAHSRARRGLPHLGRAGQPLPRLDGGPLVRERRLRARRDRGRGRRADAEAARVLALRRRLEPADHRPRRAHLGVRADGRRRRLLHERRRRLDRDRRQARAPLLEPRRPARAHRDHLARARLPRPRRLRHEHRRHRRVQGRRRAARGRHRAASPWDSADALEATIREIGAERIAAFFCEPIIGAGGVLLPPDGYLQAVGRSAATPGPLRRRRGDLRLRPRRRWFAAAASASTPTRSRSPRASRRATCRSAACSSARTIQEPFWSGATRRLAPRLHLLGPHERGRRGAREPRHHRARGPARARARLETRDSRTRSRRSPTTSS